MFEAWCEEFPPHKFHEQTARTFIAACRGRNKAHKKAAERDLILAYNTGAFSRASKVKPLSHYLKQIRQTGERSTAADALSFFGSLKSRGFPVSIKRIPREAA